MKRTILFVAFLLIAWTTAYAQTQQGYVKTKGRLDANGNLIPGRGLKGAVVSVHGRTAVLVNADDGAFSFPVTSAQFRVDSVRKKGYQLVDVDALSKTYKPSPNPLYIVMETPDQQWRDKYEAERKIRSTLTDQLHQRKDEIDAMKTQQKISDEQYREALQKLYEDVDQNEQLVKDMAERYSKIDYDQLDEFYRQVSFYIENGELTKADSLLKSKGNVSQQVNEQLRKGQALKEHEEQLGQAKATYSYDLDELAKRCFSYYETFAAQHMNDSAAYYLELRASLDTINIDWQLDASLFFNDYLAEYEKSMTFNQRGIRQSLRLNGEHNYCTAKCYNNIGFVYYEQGDYNNALEYLNKALSIKESLFGNNSLEVAITYNNLGQVYSELGDTNIMYPLIKTANILN